jgi:hypothetical protein
MNPAPADLASKVAKLCMVFISMFLRFFIFGGAT